MSGHTRCKEFIDKHTIATLPKRGKVFHSLTKRVKVIHTLPERGHFCYLLPERGKVNDS